MISVVILTKNEEEDLPNCLNSLSWSDDVHVLDSGSTDNTVNIALQYKAKISINPFPIINPFTPKQYFSLHFTPPSI